MLAMEPIKKGLLKLPRLVRFYYVKPKYKNQLQFVIPQYRPRRQFFYGHYRLQRQA